MKSRNLYSFSCCYDKTPCQKQLKRGRVYYGIVHPAGTQGSRNSKERVTDICCQRRAQRMNVGSCPALLLHFVQSGTPPCPGDSSTDIQVGPPTSTNVIKIVLYRHAQRSISLEILDPDSFDPSRMSSHSGFQRGAA